LQSEPVIRVGGSMDEIWIDLGNSDWSAVRVTAEGWSIEDQSNVPFVRTGAMRPLPEPARKSSVWIHFVPDLDEPVAVTWIIDRDRHSDEIGELAANAIERPVDQREAGSRLGFEIVHDRFSVQVRILWNINGFATWINPLCS